MNLTGILNDLKYISLAHPLINDFYEGDIMKINHTTNKYPLIGIQADNIEFGNTSRFTLKIYYVDRLLKDESNKTAIQTNGGNALQQILNTFNQKDDVYLEKPYSLSTFTEQFGDLCAGIFSDINVEVRNDIGDCGGDIVTLNPFNNYYTKIETDNKLDLKQNKLIPGTGITIIGDTISAVGGGGAITFEDKYADTIANWEMLGGTYNSTSGFFEYDELTDITLAQAVDSFKKSRPLFHQNLYRLAYMLEGAPRVFINILVRNFSSSPVVTPTLQQMFYASPTIEYCNFNYCSGVCTDTFNGAINLKYLKWLRIKSLTNLTFKDCNSLTLLERIEFPNADVYLGDSPLLTLQAMNNIFTSWNATTNNPTLTVHADIYDKIYNNTNPNYATWNPLDAIAITKNINIAQ